jgi:hypothetical protein
MFRHIYSFETVHACHKFCKVFRTPEFYVHYIGNGTSSIYSCVTDPKMAWNKVETVRIFLHGHNTTVKCVSNENFLHT